MNEAKTPTIGVRTTGHTRKKTEVSLTSLHLLGVNFDRETLKNIAEINSPSFGAQLKFLLLVFVSHDRKDASVCLSADPLGG